MVAFAKVVDIVVGLVVLLAAINITVSPLANDALNSVFDMGNQTKEYVEGSSDDFQAYDIEENFGVAGVSIQGVLDAIQFMADGVNEYIEYGDFVRLRDEGSIDRSTQNPLERLNDEMVDRGLFGVELTRSNYEEYICEFVEDGGENDMNPFVYFDFSDDGVTGIDCDGFSVILEQIQGDATGYNRAEKETIYEEISVGINSGVTYRINNLGVSADFSVSSHGSNDPDDYINVKSELKMLSKDSGTNYNLYKTSNEKVGCSPYLYNDMNRYCYVVGFELPDEPASEDNIVDFLRDRANAYKSPNYVLYYESLAEGEEAAWGYDFSANIMKNTLFAGGLNAAFDIIPVIGKGAGLLAKGGFNAIAGGAVLARRTLSKASMAAASEVSERISREAAENAVERITTRTIRNGFRRGNKRIIDKGLQMSHLADAFSYDKTLKGASDDFVGYIARQIDDAGDVSALRNLDITEVRRSIGVDKISQERANLLVGRVRNIVRDMPSDIDKLATTSTFRKNTRYVFKKEGTDEMFERLTTRIGDDLPFLTNLRGRARFSMKDRLNRFVGKHDWFLDSNGVFDPTKIWVDLSQSEIDDIIMKFDDELVEMISSQSDGLFSRFFSNVPTSTTRAVRKQSVFIALVLKDFFMNMGSEKYYPAGKNSFVLYDPSEETKDKRVAKYEVNDPLSTYVNLNKEVDSRFYLASPCKADVKVTNKICSCEVTSGSMLLKQGDFYKPVKNVEATDEDSVESVYFFDSLSQDEKDEIIESASSVNFLREFVFGSGDQNVRSSRHVFYDTLFDNYPGYVDYIFDYVKDANDDAIDILRNGNEFVNYDDMGNHVNNEIIETENDNDDVCFFAGNSRPGADYVLLSNALDYGVCDDMENNIFCDIVLEYSSDEDDFSTTFMKKLDELRGRSIEGVEFPSFLISNIFDYDNLEITDFGDMNVLCENELTENGFENSLDGALEEIKENNYDASDHALKEFDVIYDLTFDDFLYERYESCTRDLEGYDACYDIFDTCKSDNANNPYCESDRTNCLEDLEGYDNCQVYLDDFFAEAYIDREE
ncbi:MAG: hypothetical protein R6V50_01735, partial [Thermoplasmatota archaeon]